MKKELLAIIIEKCIERRDTFQKAVNNAQNAANEESKNSAGDKYETGRAMAQNDRDLYARQLIAAENDLVTVRNIKLDHELSTVQLGALVTTNIGIFFISISAGSYELAGKKIMTTSTDSPIGKILSGRSENSKVDFRGKLIELIRIE